MNENQRKLEYFYAKVKVTTRKCMGVFTSSEAMESDVFYEYIEIEGFNLDYKDKYYINGEWYEDAQGTIPWSPT